MTPGSRLLIVAIVVLVAFLVAWVVRRGVALRRRSIVLPAEMRGSALFTSETCGSCERARVVAADVFPSGLVEIVWEEAPERFELIGIDRVPALVWSDGEGRGWRVDGVPTARQLRRWLGDP